MLAAWKAGRKRQGWTHLNTHTVVGKGRTELNSEIRELAALEQVQHLITSSPDPAQNMPCQPRDKFMSSQIMVLMLTSIKAANILFFHFSLQINNSCLYKPNYTSTKALERKGNLTAIHLPFDQRIAQLPQV